MTIFILTAILSGLANTYVYFLGRHSGLQLTKPRKFIVPFKGRVAVGDTVEFPGDPNVYAVVGINEDGIVIKRLT